MSTLSTPEFLLTPGLLIIYDHAGVTILVSNSCHVGGIHRNPTSLLVDQHFSQPRLLIQGRHYGIIIFNIKFHMLSNVSI